MRIVVFVKRVVCPSKIPIGIFLKFESIAHPSATQAASTPTGAEGFTTPTPTRSISRGFDFNFGFTGTLTPNHPLWGHFENAVTSQYLGLYGAYERSQQVPTGVRQVDGC
jgi:hypothetical protein